MNLDEKLFDIVKYNIENQYNITVDSKLIQFQSTRKDFEGDITLVVFPLAKITKKSPADAASEIGTLLKDNVEIIADFNTIQGFLNLVIDNSFWLSELNEISSEENFGKKEKKNSQLMVEYSSPNTNKPLHLGHLRNNFLGYSVAQILEANGNDVIKTQIINDRGIHICKSMLAWDKFGNGETPTSSGLKGDKLVGKYYVAFDKALKEETKQLLKDWESGSFNTSENVKEEYLKLATILAGKEDEKAKKGILDKIKKLADNQTPIMQEVKDTLIKWENKEEKTYALWEKMNNWVYDGFDITYEAMNVSFDKLYYESNTFLTGKEMVQDGLAKGVFYKKEDGSVWIDLTDEGLDEKLVLRSDGTAVYVTQDIGTAQQRMQDYSNLNGIVYTVGNEQDYHFKVLFLILKKLGYQWADNCFHLSYGMVDLPTGKMKSREGTVVDADDLIREVVAKAKAMTKERGHLEGMSEEEKELLYRTIGLGGLKYYLLKVDPGKRMLFNPEESVELNGNTGPFIQYVHARICSLLKKGDQNLIKVDTTLNMHSVERELIKKLVAFPALVDQAGKEYSPALIANYAYELSKNYNSFFQSISIFKGEDDESYRNMRLQLSKNVGKVIKLAMNLLGIDVPTRM